MFLVVLGNEKETIANASIKSISKELTCIVIALLFCWEKQIKRKMCKIKRFPTIPIIVDLL